jgi:hypothetical protein
MNWWRGRDGRIWSSSIITGGIASTAGKVRRSRRHESIPGSSRAACEGLRTGSTRQRMDESHMIATHDRKSTTQDLWATLAAPLPTTTISWRQDGRPIQRDGRPIARFVAYVDANTVRERLDSVVPGEWDMTLELLP